MAKVFLDTNYFIGLVNKTPDTQAEVLHAHQGLISVLSCHILYYVNKIKVPDKATSSLISDFNLIEFGNTILNKALLGPITDLEDNIQLHSAAEADCDYFLTNDKKLLKMKFFGKTQITKTVSPSWEDVS